MQCAVFFVRQVLTSSISSILHAYSIGEMNMLIYLLLPCAAFQTHVLYRKSGNRR